METTTALTLCHATHAVDNAGTEVLCIQPAHGMEVAHAGADDNGRTYIWSVRPEPCAMCGATQQDAAEHGPVAFRTLTAYDGTTDLLCSDECAYDWREADVRAEQDATDADRYWGDFSG